MRDYLALIIAYRDHDLVARVLAQLAAQTRQPAQVFVVDNGATLNDAQLSAMPLAERCTLITRPDNPGYGAAVNAARGRLGGASLLVLTHDASFGPNLAERLLAALESQQPGSSAQSHRQTVKPGCAAPVLHLSSAAGRVFSAGGRLTRGGRAWHLTVPLHPTTPYPVDWVDGAIVMYSESALDRIGWIAEEYFLYFEDVDTGWRLAQAGLACVVVPSAQASQQPGSHPSYLGIRNMALFARKAGIGRLRSGFAIAYRIVRETLGRLRRGRAVQLGQALHGWRDGRAGLSGNPAARR